MAAATIVYDGNVSGALIAAAMTMSGANCVPIVYANGMKVLILNN